jgi:hypothetical protein
MKTKMLSLLFAFTFTHFFAVASSGLPEDEIVGKWNKSGIVWSLNADHTFTFLNGSSSISGKYTVKGDEVTIVDETATGMAQACGPDKKGVYKFKIIGNTLTLTEVSDTCTGRSGEVIGNYDRK